MKKEGRNILTILNRGFISLLIVLFTGISGFGQNVGINAGGAPIPNASAGLDINFSNSGFLIPRIALAGITSSLPVQNHIAGLIIYNISLSGDLTPGFYFNNGSKWVASLPKTVAAGDMHYWNGNSWTSISMGQPGQLLRVSNTGVPAWSGAGYADSETAQVSNITSTTAVSGGNVTNNGGTAVTAFGVCWSTIPKPDITGNKTTDGSGTGTFISNITGLVSGTVYYIRSYATNGTGTSYGNQIIFKTQ